LWTAGRDLGLAHFGGRALSALRLEKGYGSFNKDFRPDHTPAETGLDRFVDGSKTGFRGEAAVRREAATGPKRRFVTLLVEDGDADVVGYETILQGEEVAGVVTSGGFGHRIGRSLALGYLRQDLVQDGARFSIDILGARRAAVVSLKAPYDPQGLRLRN
jgi:dimethylglycine dehydrogenase